MPSLVTLILSSFNTTVIFLWPYLVALSNRMSKTWRMSCFGRRKIFDLVLDKTSAITLTGDTYVKSLTNADSSNGNIDTNGYKLYVDGALLK